jgi:3-deoxy-manno-octulosonate cytidylyltransferase (CMP-KDO synthetase)
VKPSAVAVIPARLSSTRLPRKMLLAETGRPLVEHTWRNAASAGRTLATLVATDSEEIAAAVRVFGGDVVLTSPEAASGTARIVEALPDLPPAEIIVNVQGDEPELPAAAIDAAIDLLACCPEAGVATLVAPLRRREDLDDPAAVKAVLTPWRDAAAASPQPAAAIGGSLRPDAGPQPTAATGGTPSQDAGPGVLIPPTPGCWRAIYFSRAPVPAARDWADGLLDAEPPLYWQHVGLYAYRRWVLEAWDTLPESRLAAHESLEQLRLIEAGIPIVAGVIPHATRGIDTPRDYAAFVERCGRA